MITPSRVLTCKPEGWPSHDKHTNHPVVIVEQVSENPMQHIVRCMQDGTMFRAFSSELFVTVWEEKVF